MNNVHPIHLLSKRHQTELDEQRLEQACDWISRIDRGLQPEEHQALQQWLAENPQQQQTATGIEPTASAPRCSWWRCSSLGPDHKI